MKDLAYFQMRAYLYPREIKQSVSFKLKELEQVWYCNQKNVKIKIRKFEENGRCTYHPGRGRGNPSRINFTNPLQQEIEQAVLTCIEHDQIERIFQLLQLPIPNSWIANVSKEVKKLLGLQSANQSKEVLRLAVEKRIVTLDPQSSAIDFENYLIQQLGSTLVTYDQQADTINPHIAHRWKVENDYRTWTFFLRKGVQFHHQRNLHSGDVKYTIERLKDRTSSLNWIVSDIQMIECVSPFIVRIQLAQSNPLFIRYMSTIPFSILPEDEPFDENKWIGTGPFQLKKRTDTMIVLEAFDQYFLARPLIDEIEFYLLPSESNLTMTIQVKGEEKEESTIRKEDMITGFRFLAFNLKRSSIVLQHSFRLALFHLLDMKQMWKDLGRENLIEASSYFPWKSHPDTKDKKLVKSLLKKSGYQGETITLYTRDTRDEKEQAEWFMKAAGTEGIHLKCIHFHMDDFYSATIDQEADLLFAGEVTSDDYHLSFLDSIYNKSNVFQRFIDRKNLHYIENYLEHVKYEPNYKKREAWIDKVEQYLRNEHLIVYRYHPVIHRKFHHLIQDTRFEAFGYDDFRKSWIEKE
ncbi:ABC transporter substrate-binding protein [Cytobacillus sp. Hm23]